MARLIFTGAAANAGRVGQSFLRRACFALIAMAVLGTRSVTVAAQESYPNPLSNQLRSGITNTANPALRATSAEPRVFQSMLLLNCQAARRNDPTALLNLGWIFLNGLGVRRNDATAVLWLRKAAQHGMPQAANLLGLLPGISPAVSDGCPSVGTGVDRIAVSAAVEAIIDKTAMAVGISLPLLRSVISVESSFNPDAVSKKNAVGLMQLMPTTAARFGVQNRFDPDENVRAGAKYLRWLVANFHGDVSLALAAYNAGEQAVRDHSGIPPFPETKAYVAAVKQRCAC